MAMLDQSASPRGPREHLAQLSSTVRRQCEDMKNILLAIVVLQSIGWASLVAQGSDSTRPYVQKSFLILRSTTNYAEARQVAEKASNVLEIPLDLRGLLNRDSGGLTLNKGECSEAGWGYPCYVARGRDDDGAYISIEYSTAYEGFTKGLYIVVGASGNPDSAFLKRWGSESKKKYPDSYIKHTEVYVGCIH